LKLYSKARHKGRVFFGWRDGLSFTEPDSRNQGLSPQMIKGDFAAAFSVVVNLLNG
jgi:hypothetical protein